MYCTYMYMYMYLFRLSYWYLQVSDYKRLQKFNVADDMLYVCLWYGKGHVIVM